MSSISVSSLVLGSLTMEVEGADASLSLSVLATAPAVLSVELGTPGAQGDAATIAVGTTATLAPGSSATVANAGTSSAAVFNFGIPAGQTGATGATGSQGPAGTAATIAAGTTTTGAAGSSASVTNVGTSSAAVFNFTIPRGDKGETGNTGATGATGSPGTAATIAAGTTTTGAPGSSASVTNSGTSGAAVFDFTIPRGDVGATGATGATGPAGPGVAAGGSTGQFLSKASGASYDTTWSTIVPGDRYLTTSTTSLSVSSGSKTLTIGTGLAYTATQDVTIAQSTTPNSYHMHGVVTSYDTSTGVLVADIQHHTGTGTFSAWTVNVGGLAPASVTNWGSITGTLSSQTDLQTALDAKAPLASPALTGTPTAPTATAGTSTTQLATTAFVTTADNLKANLASPTFTGVPAAPTATAGTNTTQLATTAFVTNGLSTKANLASPTFTGTVTIPAGASISGFAPLASPALTGTPTAPTASTATNTTQIATTAYVKAQGYATLASPTFTGTVTIPAGASISGYLTTSSAASTYQTLSGMSSYLTTSAAASTYLSQSNAASTYQTLSGMSSYLTTSAAASTYQPIGSYLTDAPSDGNTYGRLNGAWSVVGGGGVAWGAITGTLSSQTDLQSALDDKLPLAGGAMDTNAEITTATNTDSDSLLAGWGLGVQQTSDNTKGTTLEFDGLDTYDGSSHMVVSPTGLTFPDSTTQTTAALADAPSDGSTYGRLNGAWSIVAGGTLAADQLSAGVVTANPTTGPTTAGDVLQYNGTDLVWAAGGGGGGAVWGGITGTVTDQTDLVTYVTGLGYQTAGDVSTYVGANAYPLTGNPDNFTTADLARKQAIVESVRAVVDDAGIGFNGGGNYFIPLNPGSLVNPVNNSEFSSSGKWFAVIDWPSTTVPVSSVTVSSGVVIITSSLFTLPVAGRGLLYTEDGGSTWYESTFKLA